ncbi:MAG TPA: N-acetyltransferase [Lachnospiraceae bacterium]|nr:N-acetyltransferase [Lachnospiraceae bacterium]
MVATMQENIVIRGMQESDVEKIFQEFESLGWNPKRSTYEKYYQEYIEQKRYVFIAEYQGEVAGYTTMLKKAEGGPFNGMYPEVKDFNVFPRFRKKGIGNRILDAAEAAAGDISDTITLAVGMHSGYGAAQRIYVKRGYIPDGTGVWYQEKVLGEYEACRNDDDLNLYFSKKLR